MDTTVLLEKLINIERYIGVEPDSVIRRKVIDIEDYIVTEHEEAIERFRHTMRVAADEETAALRDAERAGSDLPEQTQSLGAALRLVWSNPGTADGPGARTLAPSTLSPVRMPWPPCA